MQAILPCACMIVQSKFVIHLYLDFNLSMFVVINIIETETVSFYAFAVVPILHGAFYAFRSDNNIDRTTQNFNNHPKHAE